MANILYKKHLNIMKCVVILLLLIFPVCLWAFDFDASFTQDLGISGGDNTDVDYSSGFTPFFSTSFGDSDDLYISAWIKVVYEYDKNNFAGEFPGAYTRRFKDYKIKAGRIPYAAPLDFIAGGYFDGAQAFYDTNFETFNNVYLSAKAAMPIKQFIVSTGLCIQTAKDFDDKTGIGLAGELGGSWITPTPFFSQLSLTGRYSNGKKNSIIPFIPVTAKPQGNLQANLSGVSALFLDYDAKLYPNVSAGLSASYFIRNSNIDSVMSFYNSGSALGCDLFGRAVWNPFTDLSVNLGAGVFLPSLGNADPDAGMQWRLELGLTLVVY